MPKSHDQKPRNKHRRLKHAKTIQPKIAKLSQRQVARRLLHQNYLEVCKAQRELEASLRAVNLKWRDLEKAVNSFAKGKWSGVDRPLLERMFRQHGIIQAQAA